MDICPNHSASLSSPEPLEIGRNIRATAGVNLGASCIIYDTELPSTNPYGIDILIPTKPNETTWKIYDYDAKQYFSWPVPGLSVCWWAVANSSNNFIRFYGAPLVIGNYTIYKQNGDPIITFLITPPVETHSVPPSGTGGTTGGITPAVDPVVTPNVPPPNVLTDPCVSPIIQNMVTTIPAIINRPLNISGYYTFEASGTPSPTFSITGALPAGLAFASPSISGTPTVVGQYPITITASNSCGTNSKTFTIDVAAVAGAGVAPIITSPDTAEGTVGYPFTYEITTTGTAPITLSTYNGPAWLSLTGTELIGSPTTSGTFDITIKAVNQTGTDTKTLVITIKKNVPAIPNIFSSINIVQTADGRTSTRITGNTTQTGLDQNVISYKTFHIGNIRTSQQRDSV